ncbi:MAG: hypothetical protein ACREI8_11470 [Myxococcota bacterium]
MRDPLGLRLHQVREALLQRLRDALVMTLARALEQRLVGRLLDQRMLEDEQRVGRSPALVEQLG